jgi:hypothetical protein
MTNEEILKEFSALPSEARREALDFIAFLRLRYGKKSETKENLQIEKESFVGMWKDREDLQDASTFVREMRKNEWEN